MAVRPYTVIMMSNGITKCHEGNYDYEPTVACKEIEATNSGWNVVTLIPGNHFAGIHVFNLPSPAGVTSELQRVDVWDIPSGTTPRGKVPNCS